MRKEIMDWIKAIGISVVLEKKEFHGKVSLVVISFIGKDSKYYSLRVFYTQESILGRGRRFIGDGCVSYVDEQLFPCLNVFETKEEWYEGRFLFGDSKRLVDQLDRLADVKRGVTFGRFSLDGTHLYFNPVAMVAVRYSFCSRPQKCLVFPLEQITLLDSSRFGEDAEDFRCFMEEVGVSHLIEWRDVCADKSTI